MYIPPHSHTYIRIERTHQSYIHVWVNRDNSMRSWNHNYFRTILVSYTIILESSSYWIRRCAYDSISSCNFVDSTSSWYLNFYMQMGHVTHVDNACHTYQWVMSRYLAGSLHQSLLRPPVPPPLPQPPLFSVIYEVIRERRKEPTALHICHTQAHSYAWHDSNSVHVRGGRVGGVEKQDSEKPREGIGELNMLFFLRSKRRALASPILLSQPYSTCWRL